MIGTIEESMEPDDIARLVEEIQISNDDEPSIILEEEDVRISEAHIAIDWPPR